MKLEYRYCNSYSNYRVKQMFTIGKLSKQTETNIQTIRYYETITLMPKVARSESNQRLYTQQHAERLKFIRHSRSLGFSLDNIRQLLSLIDKPNNSCSEVDMIAKQQLKTVKQKIKILKSLQKEFERMIGQCSGDKIADCKIIDVLSNHDLCLGKH